MVVFTGQVHIHRIIFPTVESANWSLDILASYPGRVRAAWVRGYSPASPHIVLSSCDSRRGKADGILGMTQAFILAGAQAVLTTL